MKNNSDQAVRLEASSDQNTEDLLIKSVQSSTRALIGSFREKTKLLINCSDPKLLLREGYQKDTAKQASQKFFGKSKVSFVANIPTPVRWQLTRFEDWKKKNYREFKHLFIELYFYNIWGDVVSRSSISSIWILNESIEFVIFHIASCHKVSTLISVVTTLI